MAPGQTMSGGGEETASHISNPGGEITSYSTPHTVYNAPLNNETHTQWKNSHLTADNQTSACALSLHLTLNLCW